VRILQASMEPLYTHHELMRKKASKKRVVDQMMSSPGAANGSEDLELSTLLLQAAEAAEGFSGRALRKLPFQAHAFFVQVRLHAHVNAENVWLLIACLAADPNAKCL
jgi:hypothetical protein